jgi:hypothetical protein
VKHETAANSPLGRFVERNAGSPPIPLKSTAYSIDIKSGLAVVRLVRIFRNDEKRPIEATITFPAPFDAVVTKIETRVGDRILTGKAQARVAARKTYEDAIDSGKPAVLHEELLRGLHMLSVANVAPGAEVEVAATFAVPLALEDGNGRFRIPVTVGQIYGELPLIESDALVTGGPVMEAEVTAVSDSGTIFVNGDAPAAGRASVKLDRPIEVKVVGLYKGRPAALAGRAADGRTVAVKFSPIARGDADLDIDIMLDVSGSMTERVGSNPEGNLTKWDAVKSGLSAASGRELKKSDKVNVWTFSDSCRHIGNVAGDRLGAFIKTLQFDNGGTELPGAVATVVASRSCANILLVTDGQSGRKIGVQQAVASGARFTVVLVGEGSLESSVGYLAAMTGGQMFIVSGADVHDAISAAASSMRNVSSPVQRLSGEPRSISRTIAGTVIDVDWFEGKEAAAEREGFAAAVASYAAHLAIQGMEEEKAAKFAEAEGIVSHLTSIVLVDEAAEAVEGIPSTRKIPLASPAAAVLASPLADSGGAMRRSATLMPTADERARRELLLRRARMAEAEELDSAEPLGKRPSRSGLAAFFRRTLSGSSGLHDVEDGLDMDSQLAAPEVFKDINRLTGAVSWDANPAALARGDLTGLPSWVTTALYAIASVDEVAELAKALGMPAIAVAVALLAEADGRSSRAAARIARSAFARADKALIDKARKAVGF